MYLGIETTINKHWSDKISYDVRMANKYKALKGVAPGRALFGYCYNKEKKQHEIDPAVEKDLRYIFDSFDTGDYSLKQFVRFINKAGITNRTGKKWTKGNMYSLLTKCFYAVEFLYQGEAYKGNHQPYFSKHRFEERMKRLESSYVGRTENEPTFLLAKYLKCSCGLMMTGDLKKGTYIYYKHTCPNSPRQVYIPEKKIFEMLDSAVREMRYSPDFADRVKTVAKEILEQRAENNKKGKKDIAKSILHIDEKKDKLIDLFMGGEIDRDSVKRKMDEYDREAGLLLERQKLLNSDYSKIILEVMDLVDELRDNPIKFLAESYNKKTKLLGIMADGVIIDNDVAQILWKEPYKFLLKNEILEFKSKYEKAKKKALYEGSQNANLLPRTDSRLPAQDCFAVLCLKYFIASLEIFLRHFSPDRKSKKNPGFLPGFFSLPRTDSNCRPSG
ncbi:MAG: recombinase family protein [Spirochaetales bacterium]|nr:recombinase family protein [Spirochaetales bacterium]